MLLSVHALPFCFGIKLLVIKFRIELNIKHNASACPCPLQKFNKSAIKCHMIFCLFGFCKSIYTTVKVNSFSNKCVYV